MEYREREGKGRKGKVGRRWHSEARDDAVQSLSQ